MSLGFLLGACIAGLFGGLYAQHKGRNGIGWGLGAFLFGAIVVAILWGLPDRSDLLPAERYAEVRSPERVTALRAVGFIWGGFVALFFLLLIIGA